MKPGGWRLVAWTMAGLAATAGAADLEVRTARFSAGLTSGSVGSLTDAHGRVLARSVGSPAAACIETTGGPRAALPGAATRTVAAGGTSTVAYAVSGLPAGAGLTCRASVDAVSGDLVLAPSAVSPTAGVWGVTWRVEGIPGDLAIVVPGWSGVRLDADTPGDRHVFDYPQGWEAQLVIVEGAGGGFYIFADDAAGRFKRLTVVRERGAWALALTTINDAPFDGLTACAPVAWRLNTYEGDWRVPARRYRDWMQANLKPAALATQSPSWVRDIRACAIAGLSIPWIEEFAKHADPAQTLIYVPDWRKAGYDRDYPEYASVRPELGPFLERAHALGFRVMLHMNYFGVDPLNARYREFERFHVRSPWGKHEPEWWTWNRADPPIKFAYINPASSAWRRCFVSAMTELCRRFPVDALHLDQTLCIYNDHNGRIDGMNMIQGNMALHRELRAALPQVALSGEGLNEVTCRMEAFAQRHVRGLNHSEGTWNEKWLRAAHPVSSYLFLPFTTIYGYLGLPSPSQGQLYAAWNEAYEHYGVIPTIKIPAARLAAVREGRAEEGDAFLRQLLDEIRGWQSARLTSDLDGAWPAGVAFPFRTAAGGPAARTSDGRLVVEGRTISRTLHGANRVEAAGTVPGWPGCDGNRIVGLDPEKRYALLGGAPDTNVFHLADLPEGLVVESSFAADGLAAVRMRALRVTVADLVARLDTASCGWRTRAGAETTTPGPLAATNGAGFAVAWDDLSAHPPYRGAAAGGEAFARFTVRLPESGRSRFQAGVALREGAVGSNRSDGVTFKVAARAGDLHAEAQVHCAVETPVPLGLDLSAMAGRDVDVELAVNPGPAGNPSFDWSRWVAPRVVAEAAPHGPLAVGGTQRWACAIGGEGALPAVARDGRLAWPAAGPGSVFLLAAPPSPVAFPVDLLRAPRIVAVLEDGVPSSAAREAGVAITTRASGGMSRSSFLAHPPPRGTTTIHLPMKLPEAPARFLAQVGLADGSKSEGVVFVVEVNGRELVRERMLPGAWKTVGADLAPWAGKDVVLALTTDADGSHYFDWALWGEPRIEVRP